MPQLQWDELDFLECLGVIPEEGEYHEWYIYTIEQNGLRLKISLWPFESIVCFSLFRETDSEAFFDFCIAVRGQIRRNSDKRGEFLKFTDCIIASSRFSYIAMGRIFDKELFAGGVTLELFLVPDIRLRFV